MKDYCERCKRCHDDCLRDDEECIYYGEPNGCNHPNYGYDKEQMTYEELQNENAELRECLKDVLTKYGDHIYSETLEKYKAALEGGNHEAT